MRRAIVLIGALIVGLLGVWGGVQALASTGFGQPGGLPVLPDDRASSGHARPFEVNGVVLVNARHPVAPEYVPELAEPHQLTPAAHRAYVAMVKAAKKAGRTIVWRVGYRSYDTQAEVLASSIETRGSYRAALAYTAEPGCSEHQLGLAVDIAAPKARGLAFADTQEFAWMREHAHEYGFILRYPDGKSDITGIAYEPWHYRYLGVDHARAFGPWSSLTLEEYLGGR
ncbi:MAG: M15 family metallopeptidase [Propioniciclava sp.]|uniref:M15 family metallopeptidase n=1 Tax=Propioniciclava sp. TaxID=2038686 RepID=UPI0039E291F0